MASRIFAAPSVSTIISYNYDNLTLNEKLWDFSSPILNGLNNCRINEKGTRTHE